MANYCDYDIRVIGTKQQAYFILGSMPTMDEKTITHQEGDENNYTLQFTGACKWSVHYNVSDTWEAEEDFSLENLSEEEAEELGEDYWNYSLRAKSEALHCEIMVHYWSSESEFDQFDYYKDGECLKKRKIQFLYSDEDDEIEGGNVFDWNTMEFVGHEGEYDESVTDGAELGDSFLSVFSNMVASLNRSSGENNVSSDEDDDDDDDDEDDEDEDSLADLLNKTEDLLNNLMKKISITLDGSDETSNNEQVTGDVVVQDGKSCIQAGTYSDCTEMTSIYLPDSVTEIGAYAFQNCTNLQSVRMSRNLQSIRNDAFSGCTALEKIEIPDGVLTMGHFAFDGCENLRELTLPVTLNKIEFRVFADCHSLEKVVIPDSVTEIESQAFYECRSMTSVTIPESVTKIGNNAFDACSALTYIAIPDSVTEIGDWVFYECTSLASVIIPDSVTAIGENAFSDCTALTSIVIPDSVTTIAEDAFEGCTSLIIHAHAGSYAEQYAKENGIECITI